MGESGGVHLFLERFSIAISAQICGGNHLLPVCIITCFLQEAGDLLEQVACGEAEETHGRACGEDQRGSHSPTVSANRRRAGTPTQCRGKREMQFVDVSSPV